MIYADNAATTRISFPAEAAMISCMRRCFGNPSSLHAAGQRASEVLLKSRERIAGCLGCLPDEITFTSGGSESDNQALISAAELGRRQGKMHLVSTAFEHHAVLHTLKKLESQGFTVNLLPVTGTGTVSVEQVEKALRPDTACVSVMFANNEIGSIQPVAEIGKLCRKRKILFHTDAVQAAGHLKINTEEQNIDLLSLSAHKFHGPKGIGLLYTRRGFELTPLIEGGFQERGKRAGTENLPGIAGMAAALQECCRRMTADTAKSSRLRDRLIAGLSMIPRSSLNGPSANRLPGNVNFCFEGIEGESLLLLLDSEGICASSGSACASSSLNPSHVLLALGRERELARSSLRLSLSAENTEAEINHILAVLPPIVARLRKLSPLWRDKMEGRRPFLLP